MKAKCWREQYKAETEQRGDDTVNIVVCMKQVPNTKEISIDQKTNNIIREGVPSIMNPHDANALETALEIKDKHDGQVIALSMGPAQAMAMMQEALDIGADRAILLSDRKFAGSDTLSTGYTLATAIKGLQADLVLCGAEAIDGSTGQVGPIIAENLDWPQVTCVRTAEIEKGTVVACRERKEYLEKMVCTLPAVLCILKGSNKPRRPMKSVKKPELYIGSDFSFDETKLGAKGSPTKVVKISVSDRAASSFVFLDGSLPVKERIRSMMNGGIIPQKVDFVRGQPGELASMILSDDKVKKYV